MRIEQHRQTIGRIEELMATLAQRMTRDKRLMKNYERRKRENETAIQLHEERDWSNRRIRELAASGMGAGQIADALLEERGYVITAKAVSERIRMLRVRVKESAE